MDDGDLDSLLRTIKKKPTLTTPPKLKKDDSFTRITKPIAGSTGSSAISRQATISRATTSSSDFPLTSPTEKTKPKIFGSQQSNSSMGESPKHAPITKRGSLLETIKLANANKGKVRKEPTVKNIFWEISLYFIPYDMTLTPSKITILQDLSKVRGAIILSNSDMRGMIPNYIVTDIKIPFSHVQEALPIHADINLYQFIKHEWISDCIAQDCLLNPEPYYIHFKEMRSKSPPSPTSPAEENKSLNETMIHEMHESDDEPDAEKEKPSADMERMRLIKRRVKEKVCVKQIKEAAYLFDYFYDVDPSEYKKSTTKDTELDFSFRSKQSAMSSRNSSVSSGAESDDNTNTSVSSKRKTSNDFKSTESMGGPSRRRTSENLESIFERLNDDPVSNKEDYWSKKQDFVCQAPIQSSNLNEHLTKPLENIMNAYRAQGDKGRTHGYRRAINFLKVFPKRIESAKEIEGVKGIGTGIRDKVAEILATGKLEQEQMFKNDERIHTIEMFYEIWGVGPEKATRLYEMGFRTIEELKENSELFTDQQRTGLKYYYDFQQKMRRSEVEAIVKIITDKIDELEGPNRYNLTITGSYRRGRELCGDVDIVMAPKDDRDNRDFPNKLVKALEGTLFFDHLQKPYPKHGCQTYIGVAQLPGGTPRKVDMKHYPREMFGLGVLYFTGSGNYYRDMRRLASKMGYKLSDEGLFRRDGTVRNTNTMLPCYTEEDVFKFLGLEWKQPTERDLG
jgi:DNA polymerase lambda